MAPSTSSRLFVGLFVMLWSGRLYAANGCFSSIISFGDSIADTGNTKYLASISDDVQFLCVPPYGQNFIGQSTGRCSNGRLIIDFLGNSSLRLCKMMLGMDGDTLMNNDI
ncbi:putative sinapine esterase [Helianthus annuus]|nr:putative sinapine esterase [Helianthus annuus]